MCMQHTTILTCNVLAALAIKCACKFRGRVSRSRAAQHIIELCVRVSLRVCGCRVCAHDREYTHTRMHSNYSRIALSSTANLRTPPQSGKPVVAVAQSRCLRHRWEGACVRVRDRTHSHARTSVRTFLRRRRRLFVVMTLKPALDAWHAYWDTFIYNIYPTCVGVCHTHTRTHACS